MDSKEFVGYLKKVVVKAGAGQPVVGRFGSGGQWLVRRVRDEGWLAQTHHVMRGHDG